MCRFLCCCFQCSTPLSSYPCGRSVFKTKNKTANRSYRSIFPGILLRLFLRLSCALTLFIIHCKGAWRWRVWFRANCIFASNRVWSQTKPKPRKSQYQLYGGALYQLYLCRTNCKYLYRWLPARRWKPARTSFWRFFFFLFPLFFSPFLSD